VSTTFSKQKIFSARYRKFPVYDTENFVRKFLTVTKKYLKMLMTSLITFGKV